MKTLARVIIGFAIFCSLCHAASEPESVQLKVNRGTGNVELRAFVNCNDLIPAGNTPLSKDQLKAVIKRVQKECEAYIKAEMEATEKRGKPREEPPPPPAEIVPLPSKSQTLLITPPLPRVGAAPVMF